MVQLTTGPAERQKSESTIQGFPGSLEAEHILGTRVFCECLLPQGCLD